MGEYAGAQFGMTLNLASVTLLAFVLALVVFDVIALRGKNRRALLVELAAFVTGAFFIVFPDRATSLAHVVGIGRGVDFLLYPIVIWLVRESLLTRRRRLEDAERITELTRALAIAQAQDVSKMASSIPRPTDDACPLQGTLAPPRGGSGVVAPGQSPVGSASTTT